MSQSEPEPTATIEIGGDAEVIPAEQITEADEEEEG
jgi:hypothetical protein